MRRRVKKACKSANFCKLNSNSRLLVKKGRNVASFFIGLLAAQNSNLAVLRNNKVEAVLISKDEYEKIAETLKRVEGEAIMRSIQQGLTDLGQGLTKPIDTLWDAMDD